MYQETQSCQKSIYIWKKYTKKSRNAASISLKNEKEDANLKNSRWSKLVRFINIIQHSNSVCF